MTTPEEREDMLEQMRTNQELTAKWEHDLLTRMVEQTWLPRTAPWAELEAMGVINEGDTPPGKFVVNDLLLTQATLPAGWTLRIPDTGRRALLTDQHGIDRAEITCMIGWDERRAWVMIL